jgi:hypothetical protein
MERQAYLRKRRRYQAEILLYGLPCLAYCVFCHVSRLFHLQNLRFLLFGLVVVLIALVARLPGFVRAMSELETLRQNPVAPITAATLPAAEILVRASAESPALQSETLLRAAQSTTPPQEELLRPLNKA